MLVSEYRLSSTQRLSMVKIEPAAKSEISL